MVKRREIVNGRHLCCACRQWKSVSEFYSDKIAHVGLRGRCKKCDLEKVNNHHSSSTERALKNLVIKNRVNGKHGSARRQEFSQNSCVTLDFVKKLWESQDGRCAVTGVAMTHIQGQGRRIWTNVTVDRIDPDIGYTHENTRLICRAANYMKAAMSDAEMLEWCKKILNGPVAEKLAGSQN